MDEKKEGVFGETSAPTGTQQSAQDDLKKVADRAKAAASGFDFNKLFVGRVDRVNYLYIAIAAIVAGSVLSMIPLIGWIISLALGVLGFGVSARRFHDINITGWASLSLLIPFVGILVVIYLCWKHGDEAKNQYGEVPDPKRDMFKAMLNT